MMIASCYRSIVPGFRLSGEFLNHDEVPGGPGLDRSEGGIHRTQRPPDENLRTGNTDNGDHEFHRERKEKRSPGSARPHQEVAGPYPIICPGLHQFQDIPIRSLLVCFDAVSDRVWAQISLLTIGTHITPDRRK
jgi:hypothetical protein